MSQVDSMVGLPPRLRLAWTIWGILGIVLIGASVRYREVATIGTLAEDMNELKRQNETLLRELLKRPVFQVGSIPLPEPEPDRKIGWPGVLIDTLLVTSIDAIEPAVVDAIFARVTEDTSLVNYVIAGDVVIDSLTLTTPDPSVPKSGGPPRYRVEITVRNSTGKPLSVDIPRGQVFENADRSSRLQNLVAADAVAHVLPVGVDVDLQVPAYCLNKDFGRPRGQSGYITPLQIEVHFSDQDALWQKIYAITDR